MEQVRPEFGSADTHRKRKEQYTKNDRMDTQLISRKLIDGRLDSITIRNIEREQLRSLFRRWIELILMKLG